MTANTMGRDESVRILSGIRHDEFNAAEERRVAALDIAIAALQAQGEPAAEDFHDVLYGAKVKLYLDPENDESSVELRVGVTFGPNDNLEIMLHAVEGDEVVKLYRTPPAAKPDAVAGLVEKWHERGDELAKQYCQFPDGDPGIYLLKAAIDAIDRCRGELEAALGQRGEG